MRLPLTWRPAARIQFFQILDYIAYRDEQAALHLQSRIEECIELARHLPKAFRSGRRRGTREIVVHPNYIVVYRVTKAALVIVPIVHSRQKYP